MNTIGQMDSYGWKAIYEANWCTTPMYSMHIVLVQYVYESDTMHRQTGLKVEIGFDRDTEAVWNVARSHVQIPCCLFSKVFEKH